MSALARPPLDPELAAPLALMPEMTAVVDGERLSVLRAESGRRPAGELIEGRGIELTEHAVTSFDGALIDVSVLRRRGHADATAPGVYAIHGGGMVGGHRYAGVEAFGDWIEEYGAVVATVEYRLAPEHRDPVPVEDCYAGLAWFAGQADVLGFDPGSLLITGGSAGGGLAAGTTLLARDRRGPAIAWQMLSCPMLDDRDRTVSTRQITDGVPWARASNRFGWSSLLGDRYGTDDVSIYAAPARATDLSGLPPAFIDVGDAEVFRDEVVAYASGIWAAGGNAELHVWPGAYHGFTMVPTAAVSQAATRASAAWLRRQFSRLAR
jgi:acetyl esterase/lipase